MNGGCRYQIKTGELRITMESRAAIEGAVPQICRVHVTAHPLECYGASAIGRKETGRNVQEIRDAIRQNETAGIN